MFKNEEYHKTMNWPPISVLIGQASIAIFKHNADGTVKGKGVSWAIDGSYFPSLKDAIINFKWFD